MKIKIKLDNDAKIPSAAHETDTGYDITAISDPVIVGEQIGGGQWKSIQYIEYDTGLQVEPESLITLHGALDIFPRSSISKTNLVLANSVGLCDHSYRGNIKLRFKYIWQPEDMRVYVTGRAWESYCVVNQTKIYQKGDRIGQLVPRWQMSVDWIKVDSLDETKRGAGGFGSSGTK